MDLRVDAARLRRDLAELGAIGRTAEGGVSRASWSEADMQARRWLQARTRAPGLESRVDPAGNIFGRWQPGGPVVLVGSHLDSVPKDGRSHSPAEFTSDEDVERGANVLLLTLLQLAAG